MMTPRILLLAALMGSLAVTEAVAECEIADAKLEEAVQNNPRLRGPANSQSVRDLRSLRDAAMTLLLKQYAQILLGFGVIGLNAHDLAKRR